VKTDPRLGFSNRAESKLICKVALMYSHGVGEFVGQFRGVIANGWLGGVSR